jgi:S1-C subfamily serine protease
VNNSSERATITNPIMRKWTLIACILFALIPSWTDAGSFRDVVKNVSECVYRVELPGGQFLGSAFSINRYGDMITCAHVVMKGESVFDSLMLSGYFYEATVVSDSSRVKKVRYHSKARVSHVLPQLDIAVIRADLQDGKMERISFMSIDSSATRSAGDEVGLCGYIPDSFTTPRPFVSRGIISVIRESLFMDRAKPDVDIFQMDLTAGKGMSGGPVFLCENGACVGIQDAAIFDANSNWQSPFPIAVSVNQLRVALDSLKIPYVTVTK